MAENTDQPTTATKKKKLLAFLNPAPRPTPAYSDDFDFTQDGGNTDKKKENDDDGLNMFRKSNHFSPMLVKKDAEDSDRKSTPDPKADAHEHAAEDSDLDPIHSSVPSCKRRKLSSPEVIVDAYHSETYDDLCGPATPPRRASTSATPRSRRKQSTPASVRPVEQAPPSTGKSKGRGNKTTDLVQSDLLPTPTSRSQSHKSSAEVVVLIDDDDEDAVTEVKRRDHTRSPRKGMADSPSAARRCDTPILLDDSDDDLIYAVPEPQEDEFAHFIAAARKREQAAREAAAAAAAAAAASDTSLDDEAETSAPTGKQGRRKKDASLIPVKIFVNSRIAALANKGPNMFGCQRRSDQSMGPVKNAFVAWLEKNSTTVSKEMQEDIFLTWRGRRIYESVSIIGLGCQLEANGRLHAPEWSSGYNKGGILLEAWTEEDFERYTAEQERQRLRARGDLVEEGGEVEVDEDSHQEETPQQAKFRLCLKEKDKEPVKLTAYSDTQVRVLIGAYRRQKGVPQDREIRLHFDGDWLDPLTVLEEADIDDGCTIEVYLK